MSPGVGRTFREGPTAGGSSPGNGVFRAREPRRERSERLARADHPPTAENADGRKGELRKCDWEKCSSSSSSSRWTRRTYFRARATCRSPAGWRRVSEKRTALDPARERKGWPEKVSGKGSKSRIVVYTLGQNFVWGGQLTTGASTEKSVYA